MKLKVQVVKVELPVFEVVPEVVEEEVVEEEPEEEPEEEEEEVFVFVPPTKEVVEEKKV